VVGNEWTERQPTQAADLNHGIPGKSRKGKFLARALDPEN
jgi:hypothetical protein